MCALFGSDRDASLLRHLNRELLHDVISQQCALYKFKINETPVNIYGEASKERFYDGPLLLNALITINGSISPSSDNGVDFKWPISFAFLRDDLLDINIIPEVGDIILYQESYWEIDNTNETQFWVGKDPDYPYNNENGTDNPLNPNLNKFGYNLSIICDCHKAPSDKINIKKSRL